MTLKYTKVHEWIAITGNIATVGITDYAQEQLGDVVFVDLPEIGDSFDAGDDASVIESVKTASDIYAPISGEITAVNEDLESDPALVNTAHLDGGWIFKMTIGDASELDDLLDESQYNQQIG